MKKMTYLDRLGLAARWMLSPEEAEEVVSDYADLLEGDRRPGRALCREFGPPWKAVGLLRQPGAYRSWLVLFCLMAACLLVPLCSALFQWYNAMEAYLFIQSQFLILGAAFLLALLGFRRFGAEKQRLSPAFFVLAAVLVFLGACTEGTTFLLFNPMFPQWTARLSAPAALRLGQFLNLFLHLTAVFSAVSGVWALIRARVSDRRWRAVFLLSLVILLAVLRLCRILRGMDVSLEAVNWWNRYTVEMVLLTVLGLAGTGVLLC